MVEGESELPIAVTSKYNEMSPANSYLNTKSRIVNRQQHVWSVTNTKNTREKISMNRKFAVPHKSQISEEDSPPRGTQLNQMTPSLLTTTQTTNSQTSTSIPTNRH
jgi:hypothetical protein